MDAHERCEDRALVLTHLARVRVRVRVRGRVRALTLILTPTLTLTLTLLWYWRTSVVASGEVRSHEISGQPG